MAGGAVGYHPLVEACGQVRRTPKNQLTKGQPEVIAYRLDTQDLDGSQNLRALHPWLLAEHKTAPIASARCCKSSAVTSRISSSSNWGMGFIDLLG
jgi:hypothetical protein